MQRQGVFGRYVGTSSDSPKATIRQPPHLAVTIDIEKTIIREEGPNTYELTLQKDRAGDHYSKGVAPSELDRSNSLSSTGFAVVGVQLPQKALTA